MTLISKHLILLSGATFLLATASHADSERPLPPWKTTETTKTIDKTTKKQVIPPITAPEQQLKIKEDNVMEPFPG